MRFALLVWLLAAAAGCEERGHSLTWADPQTAIAFTLSERPVGVKRNVSLEIRGGDSIKKVAIDDDLVIGTARFVRTREWLPVLADDHVVGGYRFEDGATVGENEWNRLPYTRRTTAEGRVAERRWHGRTTLPAGFTVRG